MNKLPLITPNHSPSRKPFSHQLTPGEYKKKPPPPPSMLPHQPCRAAFRLAAVCTVRRLARSQERRESIIRGRAVGHFVGGARPIGPRRGRGAAHWRSAGVGSSAPPAARLGRGCRHRRQCLSGPRAVSSSSCSAAGPRRRHAALALSVCRMEDRFSRRG